MDDRTLLEMAAKAACYTVRWDDEHDCFYHVEPKYPTSQIDYGGGYYTWMPLEDDGDALRLAAKLRFGMDQNGPSDFFSYVSISNDMGMILVQEEIEDESHRQGAVRYAIVRAAAEIGKEMK